MARVYVGVDQMQQDEEQKRERWGREFRKGSPGVSRVQLMRGD